MKLYLDMDGVLVDFVSQVEKYDFFTSTKKVKWDDIVEKGTGFWSEMDWIPEAEKAFNILFELHQKNKIDLFILSAVDYEVGIEGKRIWLQNHTKLPLSNAFLVRHSRDKAKFAEKNSILVDDREKCLIPFTEAGGKTLLFTTWQECMPKLLKLISETD